MSISVLEREGRKVPTRDDGFDGSKGNLGCTTFFESGCKLVKLESHVIGTTQCGESLVSLMIR